MTYHALAVDDSPDVLEDVKDRLEALGHTCDCVTCLQCARDHLAKNSYSYILLDLEIPVRYGRPSRISNGQNLLREIRRMKGYEDIPIIVMTSHGHDSPDLAVEVLRCDGATDFVKKTFADCGHTLEKAIRDALATSGRSRLGAAKRSGLDCVNPPHPFEEGQMVFYPTHVELCEVRICGATGSSLIRCILDELRHRNQHGRYVRYDGTQLAKRINCDRGQNGVAESVRDFRNSVCEVMLEEANIKIDRLHDVILNDRKYGYRLSTRITVRDGDDTVNESEGDPDDTKADPVNDPEDRHWNHRQEWILNQLKDGHPLQKSEVRSQFRCSDSTAKRDLKELKSDGLIEFVRPAKTGHYRLKKLGQADSRSI